MLRTDVIGLIGQHDKNDPSYLDFGDSCFKTSMAAIGRLDNYKDLLLSFLVSDGSVIRHPKTRIPDGQNSPNMDKWADPKETSRDQLIPYVVALYLCGYRSAVRMIDDRYTWFINKDILSPSVQLIKKICAGRTPNWFIKTVGTKMIEVDIWWSTKIRPDHELNQMICVCLVMGKQYIQKLCSQHPDWKKNIRDYYGGPKEDEGWRDNKEIGEALILVVEDAIK